VALRRRCSLKRSAPASAPVAPASAPTQPAVAPASAPTQPAVAPALAQPAVAPASAPVSASALASAQPATAMLDDYDSEFFLTLDEQQIETMASLAMLDHGDLGFTAELEALEQGEEPELVQALKRTRRE
jgi:hypothetical protein